MIPDRLRPSFQHPANPDATVHVMLDACHMLKLVRNAFAEGMGATDNDQQDISWHFIENLHKIQEKEGLRLANKLKTGHIEWRKQKMKVHLAAQVISSSVADSIRFCEKNLQRQEFSQLDGTVNFLKTFDAIFDLLNSRNPCGKGQKAPMKSTNKEQWKHVIETGKKYILGLKDKQGYRLVDSKRKTGFMGFLACLESVSNIFHRYVEQDMSLKYLLTYKLSQDHLELFFSTIRARGGFNNNPTATQFKAAYKRLLVRHNARATGNCTIGDKTAILHAVQDSAQVTETRMAL